MFSIFFSISGLSLNPILVLITGFFGGVASGFLGVGCGVIITPALVEFGIPPLTAVSSQLCHAAGTNFSNFLFHKRNQNVDFQLAMYILYGGILGAILEWITLRYFKDVNLLFQKFAFIYIATLFIFGGIMLKQSIASILSHKTTYRQTSVMMRRWMLYFPLHKIFKRSRTEMSIFVPIFVGLLAGIIVTSSGGGNNLFMAPILTYLIGRISPVVRGTTSFSGFIITAIVVLVYAEQGYNCDFSLVMLLFTGAAFGIWLGAYLTKKIKKEYVNIIAAVTVFIMATRMIFKIFVSTNSFTTSFTQDMSRSKIYKIADGNSIIYSILCLFLICLLAVFFEKIIINITKRENG